MAPRWNVIPVAQQKPGRLMGGPWVVLQAYTVANHWTMAMLGPEGARVTAGYGDWEVVPIPRDVGITEWRGRRNFEMSLDLLYDGWLARPLRPNLPASFRQPPKLPRAIKRFRNPRARGPRGLWIESYLEELESLAIRQGSDSNPHSLRLYGAVPHTEKRWVIQNLEWGDQITDKQTGRRMRQQVTVHLVEFFQPAALRTMPRGKAGR